MGKASASKSKEAERTFMINYPSSMQSLEEMIALLYLISVSSQFLSWVFVFILFSFSFFTAFPLCLYSHTYVT